MSFVGSPAFTYQPGMQLAWMPRGALPGAPWYSPYSSWRWERAPYYWSGLYTSNDQLSRPMPFSGNNWPLNVMQNPSRRAPVEVYFDESGNLRRGRKPNPDRLREFEYEDVGRSRMSLPMTSDPRSMRRRRRQVRVRQQMMAMYPSLPQTRECLSQCAWDCLEDAYGEFGSTYGRVPWKKSDFRTIYRIASRCIDKAARD